nr:Bifunctional nuclease 2 [Ipomoea batatas]
MEVKLILYKDRLFAWWFMLSVSDLYSDPVNSLLAKASKILRSEFWRLDGIHCRQVHFSWQPHSQISKLIACNFSLSSNGMLIYTRFLID